ncbi:MAG: L,D-transpeptidase [Thermodesulfobacteriota bacterium]
MRIFFDRAGWRHLFWLGVGLCAVAAGSPRPAWAGAGSDDFCETVISGLARPNVGGDLSRLSFAMVRDKEEVPVYASPVDEEEGEPPLRYLPAGYVGVSLEDPEPLVDDAGEKWYRINRDEYVRAELLEPITPSAFQGVFVPSGLDKIFAWVLFTSKVSEAPGALTEPDALTIPERSLVYIHEITEANGEKWCNIGCGGWLPFRRLGLVIPRQRPDGVGANERWLDVSLNEQTLAAYEGNRMIFSTLISTGNSRFPTVQGIYRIYFKAERRKMSGGTPGDDLYFLEDVPWQMFFFQGYALHASYWHDIFGLTTSHGCINLSPKDAQWLYLWTTAPPPPAPRKKKGPPPPPPAPGTLVSIHE